MELFKGFLEILFGIKFTADLFPDAIKEGVIILPDHFSEDALSVMSAERSVHNMEVGIDNFD